MNAVGLRFLLRDMQILQVIVDAAEATEIFRKFQTGGFKDKPMYGGKQHENAPIAPNMAWMVNMHECIGIHTFDINDMLRAMQQQAGRSVGSGLFQ